MTEQQHLTQPRLQRQPDPEPVVLGLEPERADELDEIVGDVELAGELGSFQDVAPEGGKSFGNGRVENVTRGGHGDGAGFHERSPAWLRSLSIWGNAALMRLVNPSQTKS